MASGGGKAKENVIDLQRLMNQKVMIKFNGGREVVGVLKGFDPTLNVVIDDTIEYLRLDEDDGSTLPPMPSLSDAEDLPGTRKLGLVMCRGQSIMVICPLDGTEEIANPFALQQEADEQRI
eukprot:TRINITY_DN4704_c0_g1_i1.p1 TRINITY_DN4704_c0_g1~~TRINITY_DN4704_c0_g1_i1.p1  ORF type:complete len:133 (+),score=60.61 TRINITY_DN4704_c0_g1_i1:38-400(+)